MNRVRVFVRDNAARVYAALVAGMALVLHYFPELPGDLWLGVLAAVLALVGGESVQRVDRRKSVVAFGSGYRAGASMVPEPAQD